MTELLVCSAAESEYAEALQWYSKRSRSAAERFDIEIDNGLRAIAATPDRFPYCDDRHRHYLLRHFPYQIIYRQFRHELVVIAFAHTEREPGYWSNR